MIKVKVDWGRRRWWRDAAGGGIEPPTPKEANAMQPVVTALSTMNGEPYLEFRFKGDPQGAIKGGVPFDPMADNSKISLAVGDEIELYE